MGLTYPAAYQPLSTGALVAGKYIRYDRLTDMYENYNRVLGNYGRVIAENATTGFNVGGQLRFYQQTDVPPAAPNWQDIWTVYNEWSLDFPAVSIILLCQATVNNVELRAFVGATTTAAQVVVAGAGWTTITFAAIARGAANPIAMGIEAQRVAAGALLDVAYVTVRFDAQASPLTAGPQASGAYPSEITHYAQTEPHATWQHRQLFDGLYQTCRQRPTNWCFSNIHTTPATYRGAWVSAATTATEIFRFRIKPKTATVKIYALAAVSVAPNVITITARSSVGQASVNNTSNVATTPTRADWVLVGTLSMRQNQHDWIVVQLNVNAGNGYLYGLCVREVWP